MKRISQQTLNLSVEGSNPSGPTRKILKMNTKQIGDITETKILSDLIEKGYYVSIPYGDNYRYDFIVDRDDGKLLRVQCKTGRYRDGVIKFSCCSSSNHRKNGKRKSYTGDVDWFAIYCPETKCCYYIKVKNCPTRNCSLRIKDFSTIRKYKTRWAENFLIF